MESKPKTRRLPKEGRVNIPLGKHYNTLSEQAKKCETTKTELARILIVDGLADLASGKIAYRKPGLEVAQ